MASYFSVQWEWLIDVGTEYRQFFLFDDSRGDVESDATPENVIDIMNKSSSTIMNLRY